MEEDLRRDTDGALVRLPARQGDPLVEPRVLRSQLACRRLAALAHSGQTDLFQLLQQRGRIGSDAALGEHGDRPPALRLRDGSRGCGVDHRHVGKWHEEEGPAHGEQLQDAALLVHLLLDRTRRGRGHAGACLEEDARRVGRVDHYHGCRSFRQRRCPRASGQSMPDPETSAALAHPDVLSRHSGLRAPGSGDGQSVSDRTRGHGSGADRHVPARARR